MMGMIVEDADPTEIECDTKVNIKFVDKPKGTPMDMYAVPAEKPKSRKTQKEKDRMNAQLEPIRQWIAKKYGKK
jgi:hypothetical protein